jgi:signal transduction histidine kinase
MLLVAALVAVVCPLAAYADDAETAKDLSERAAAYIQQVGPEKAFADFTAGANGFKTGQFYVFCYDPTGINLAHGGNPSFVGKNMLEVKDPDGTRANAVIIDKGMKDGRGWVEFKWVNPVTNKIQPKKAYVIKTGNAICGVGYYY